MGVALVHDPIVDQINVMRRELGLKLEYLNGDVSLAQIPRRRQQFVPSARVEDTIAMQARTDSVVQGPL